MNLESHRLIFIGGLHRSGTTPLARLLAEHPDVSGFTDTGVHEDEGQHLQGVYPPARTYGGSGHFAAHKDAHLTEQSPLVTATNAAALVSAWSTHWDMSKPYLLEKSPPNLLMTRFLQALFPHAAFVMVVRHPVTVALSTKKWTRLISRRPQQAASLHGLVKHWLTAHQLLIEDMRYLRRVHVLYYEDLIAQPDAELEALRCFLRLSSPIPEASLSNRHNEAYSQIWASYASWWRPGGWQRWIITKRYASQMTKFGYDVEDLMRHAKVQL